MDRLWRLTVVDYRQFSLEKEMASHSSILAWRIPWTEEPGGYSPWSRKESDTTEWLTYRWSILLGSRATALHLPAQVICSPTAAAPPHCAQALHTQAMEAKVDRNNPVLQILGTCALITDCCFWSYRCGQRGRQLQLLHLLPLVQVPHPPAEGTARGLK